MEMIGCSKETKDGGFYLFFKRGFCGFILAMLRLPSERNATSKKSTMPCVKLDRNVRSCNIFLTFVPYSHKKVKQGDCTGEHAALLSLFKAATIYRGACKASWVRN